MTTGRERTLKALAHETPDRVPVDSPRLAGRYWTVAPIVHPYLMGLLAARNAGIEVPDESIDQAISYFVNMTAPSGQVAYSGGIGSLHY